MFASSYRYVTGRAGHHTDARKRLCQHHAEQFCAKNGLPLAPALATHEEVKAAYEASGAKWGAPS